MNKTQKKIEILVEPSAEYFDLEVGEEVIIEIVRVNDEFDDYFLLKQEEKLLIIYECRQCSMKIFKNNELIYYTSTNIPRI